MLPFFPLEQYTNGNEGILLGAGSYGIVSSYKNDGKEVAIKQMTSETLHPGNLNEISIMLNLPKSDLLMPLFDVIPNHIRIGESHTVMPLGGQSLENFLENNTIPQEDMRKYVYQACSAVVLMHSYGWVHCDIKPSNFIFTMDSNLTLIDFGLSHNIYYNDPRRYDKDIYSIWYRPPELLFPDETVEENNVFCDIWALGCVIFQMLMNYAPFSDRHRPTDTEIYFRYNFDQMWHKRLITTYGKNKSKWPKRSKSRKFMTIPEILNKKSDNLLLNDLINKMLKLRPKQRIKSKDLLKHPYFQGLDNPTVIQPPIEILNTYLKMNNDSEKLMKWTRRSEFLDPNVYLENISITITDARTYYLMIELLDWMIIEEKVPDDITPLELYYICAIYGQHSSIYEYEIEHICGIEDSRIAKILTIVGWDLHRTLAYDYYWHLLPVTDNAFVDPLSLLNAVIENPLYRDIHPSDLANQIHSIITLPDIEGNYHNDKQYQLSDKQKYIIDMLKTPSIYFGVDELKQYLS